MTLRETDIKRTNYFLIFLEITVVRHGAGTVGKKCGAWSEFTS